MIIDLVCEFIWNFISKSWMIFWFNRETNSEPSMHCISILVFDFDFDTEWKSFAEWLMCDWMSAAFYMDSSNKWVAWCYVFDVCRQRTHKWWKTRHTFHTFKPPIFHALCKIIEMFWIFSFHHFISQWIILKSIRPCKCEFNTFYWYLVRRLTFSYWSGLHAILIVWIWLIVGN